MRSMAMMICVNAHAFQILGVEDGSREEEGKALEKVHF